MTENLFGMWKRKFPILKSLRTDFEFSQKIIIATAILFNLFRMEYGEDESDDEDDKDDEDDEDNQDSDDSDNEDGEDFIVIDEYNKDTIRAVGK